MHSKATLNISVLDMPVVMDALEQLAAERDEAREAARWLLPFLVNCPAHVDVAASRWPWLLDTPDN
jgi:predicted kinase